MRALEAHKPQVLEFIKLAKATGSKTDAKATALLKRLGG